ncbi:hypothetical protein PJIAN_4861 [Paludibacter jiangxiensis]|uniref:Uncharacterized protein n=1 Tax=Paludibacter jiangxiensis TaxID=681398 RepID=A0A171AUY6_9BACT|nr:hypothetical protein PJIAN_4861 [Paludibacter jiangxiensis]
MWKFENGICNLEQKLREAEFEIRDLEISDSNCKS